MRRCLVSIVTFAAIVNREILEILGFVLWRFGQDGAMIPLYEHDTCILFSLESKPVARASCVSWDFLSNP